MIPNDYVQQSAMSRIDDQLRREIEAELTSDEPQVCTAGGSHDWEEEWVGDEVGDYPPVEYFAGYRCKKCRARSPLTERPDAEV